MPKILTKQDRAEARVNPNDLEVFTRDLYGLWYIGRCIPSVCTTKDVQTGVENFMMELRNLLEYLHLDIDLSSVTMQVLNCHTEDEQGGLD